MIRSYADLIDQWPSLGDYAEDIGVQYVTAQLQKHRSSIPPEYWNLVVAGATARGIKGVSLELLAKLAAKKRRNGGRFQKSLTVQPAS